MARSLTAELRANPPGLHGAGDEYWGLAWPALEWLERTVQPGMQTLETGSGASTLVFATRGATHEAITPAAEEERRFRAECERRGIEGSQVRFRIGLSHEVLPTLEPRSLDVALIDGAHGFPYPVLDWWYIAPQLEIGGHVVLDDAFMPPVGMVVDALRTHADWEVEAVGSRTVVARKIGRGMPQFDWGGEPLGGRMSFRYLPLYARPFSSLTARLFRTKLGLAAVQLLRRRTGLKWRKRG